MTMTRTQAIHKVWREVKDLQDYLEGGYDKEKNQPHPVDIVKPCAFDEREELEACKVALDDLMVWLNDEEAEIQEEEYENMPNEGFQGHEIGS